MNSDNLALYTFLEQELIRLKSLKGYFSKNKDDHKFYNELEIKYEKEYLEKLEIFNDKNLNTKSVLHTNLKDFFNDSFGIEE